MRKDGFTLVELLAVIVILSFLGIMVGTSITESIQGVRNETAETQQKNIISAARNWGAENIYLLPTEGNSIVLSLHNLMSGGYIPGDKNNQLIDTKTHNTFSKLETLVTITNNKGAYDYNLTVVYGKDNVNLTAPIVMLKGESNMTVTGTFDDPGIIAFDKSGNELTEVTKKIQDENGAIISSISGIGTYTITYTVTDVNGTTSIKRTVVIK